MKKLVCLILSLCIIATTISITVVAEDTSTDPTIVMFDDLSNGSKASVENMGFYTKNFTLPAGIFATNPYSATYTRRADGANMKKEGSLTYKLSSVNIATTEISFDTFYYYANAYAGASSTDSAYDYLDAALRYLTLKVYVSPDNVNYTECQDVTLDKVPGPGKGTSFHYVKYTAKNLAPGTQYFKIVIPSVENITNVTVYGWDPAINSVTVRDKSLQPSVSVTDDMVDGSKTYDTSDNIIYENKSIVTTLYPEHHSLTNPYNASVSRRNGADILKEGYYIYNMDNLGVSAENTKVKITTFFYYNRSYAGALTTDSNLDALNKFLLYYGLRIYESPDNITYNECSDINIDKYPADWPGQSYHAAIYNISGLSADTKYIKISIPSLEGVTGITPAGEVPLIDNVTFENYSGGTIETQKLKLSNVYMNDMVLQANKPVTVAGLDEKGTSVTATISDGTHSYTASAVSDNTNNFKMTFSNTFAPSYTPYTLTVTDGTDTSTFSNILFGDVYLLAGQSNMHYDMTTCLNTEQGDKKTEVQNDISSATNQYLKFINIADVSASVPTTETAIESSWGSVNSTNVLKLSAIGYYFGSALQHQMNYPIGLISVPWGGTAINSWVKNGNIYNSHIYPFKDFNIKGCLWYQGESDNAAADIYATKQIKFIENLRELFGQDMPFCMVQIANYTNPNPTTQNPATFRIIREQQLQAFKYYEELAHSKGIDNKVGIVSIIDQLVSNPTNIHPEGKKELASRLLKWADSVIYGNGSEYSGPIVQQVFKNGNTYGIIFDHVGGGLNDTTGGDSIGTLFNGLQVVDSSGVAYDVQGELEGKNIIGFTSDIPNIVSVQYAYKEYNTDANISNKAGLKAPGFGPVPIETNAIIGADLKNNNLSDTSDIVPGGKIAMVRLVSSDKESGSLLACIYENNILKATKIVSVSSADYDSNNIAMPNIDLSIPSTINVNNAKIKMFFVNSLGTIKPLVNSIIQK